MTMHLALDLRDREVVLIGGGPVSARRALRFGREGARLTVIAPWVCEDLADLIESGRARWEARDYAGPADLADAWLVHTATGDRATDAAVRRDCDAARIWCIDATDSSETRVSVPAQQRVDLPGGGVTLAVSADDPARSRDLVTSLRTHLALGRVDLRRRRQGGGWVALVGGGPGAPGLITSRGLELLAAADVVVLDRLAPAGLVARLPETVRVIDVGKTPGNHPVPQNEINALLVAEASRGAGVVRLKGGDPYVLGRGGEEYDACVEAGIEVEVVSGVSSALAVPAAVGIPLTHRGLATGFSVVTGHEELPDLPTGDDHTIVLLMGVAGLSRSVASLLAAGRDPGCPIAIVERGYAPDQRITVATLDTIVDLAAERAVANPAVIVIGAVVRRAVARGDDDLVAADGPSVT